LARDIVKGLYFRQQPSAFDVSELSRVIENGYLLKRREPGMMKKTTFAPSTIGYSHGTCPRYWYLAFEGGSAIDDTDALGIANMAYGTQAHERLQNLMRDVGILIDDEIEVKMTSPPIRGFMDVLVKWKGERVVGEIKTTKQEIFLHRQATMKPTINHLLQILIYMRITNCQYGFMLYENKNTQEFLIIPVEMTERNSEILDNCLEWLRKTYANWEAQTLPTRPFTKKNKICKNCPFYKYCWESAPDGEVTLPAMELPKL
jgi:CRISPR/Cas system-associated exonuclease Cas4 (RecB family)